MSKQVRKAPLHKPAVYAKLLGRPDVSLFAEFEKDVVLQKNQLVFSHNFASHFGIQADGINVYIGVPEKLWEAFKRINFQNYSLDSDSAQLQLHYDVEVESKIEHTRSYGVDVETVMKAERLSLVFPCHPLIFAQVERTNICHVCCMTSELVKDDDVPPIAFMKMRDQLQNI